MMLDAPPPPEAETGDRAERQPRARVGIIDGDMHPALRSLADLKPYMPARWWDVLTTYGSRRRHGMIGLEPYPKASPRACRRDAWPEDGGPPGSNLALIRSQYLDAYGIDCAVMGLLGGTGQGEMNLDMAAAMASAANDWQREHMTKPEPRLRSGLVVAADDAAAAVREIERCGRIRPSPRCSCSPATPSRPAAAATGRSTRPPPATACPSRFHVFGASGHAYTGVGWPSYYVEEAAGHSTSCQSLVTSLVIEGVFERIPALKAVVVEGGFAWLPALAWRLDKLYGRLKSEVPHLQRQPSEVIRQHIWVTTQPMEEPDDRSQVLDMMDWIGWDRLLFASDYPHWDFDDPFQAFPKAVPRERVRQILSANGRAVYRL